MNDVLEREDREDVLPMVAEIVAAYLRFNTLPAAEIPELIQTVHRALLEVGTGEGPRTLANSPKPTVI